ncbi:subclass B3 metallo-beta-lactamase [Parasphingorhabdus sp.]|uniref:subclass B3 metallo-beta-lactamase n=1 Tax=Parasphingorhabdus sp. TaxID=2709688 RepID=UPI003001A8AC
MRWIAGILAGTLAACAPVTQDAAVAPAAPDTARTDVLDSIANLVDDEIPEEFDFRQSFPSWYAAVTPYQIIGTGKMGIYFVGTEGLGMYFIPTDAGHIVIDGGMPGEGQYVADAIRTLGFDPKDVKILLNSHAHLDHSGGLAELKAMTGAKLIASEGDRSALEGGFYLGSEEDRAMNAPPVQVDRIIADGERLTLGNVTLTAHITPGHSRGCTSWTMPVVQSGQSYEALLFCSATVAANRLVGPPQYQGIVADYRKTFAMTKDWRPDIFLTNHPEFSDMIEKRERQKAGDPLAFVDRDGFPAMMEKLEQAFAAALQKQTLKYNAIMSD